MSTMPGSQCELKKHSTAGENHHISSCYCIKCTLKKMEIMFYLLQGKFPLYLFPPEVVVLLILIKPQQGQEMRDSTSHAPGTGLTHFQPSWEAGIFIPIKKIPHRLVRSSNLSKGRTWM